MSSPLHFMEHFTCNYPHISLFFLLICYKIWIITVIGDQLTTSLILYLCNTIPTIMPNTWFTSFLAKHTFLQILIAISFNSATVVITKVYSNDTVDQIKIIHVTRKQGFSKHWIVTLLFNLICQVLYTNSKLLIKTK